MSDTDDFLISLVSQRQPRWKSKLWTDAARDQSCVSCNNCDGTVVLAHMPMNGVIGGDHKCHDFFGADLCSKCHYDADHGEYRNDLEWRVRMVVRTIYRRLSEQFDIKKK